MVVDTELLVDRWHRYARVKVCPECGHDQYQIRWTGDLHNRTPHMNYWRFRCGANRCNSVWWDPQRGPSGIVRDPN